MPNRPDLQRHAACRPGLASLAILLAIGVAQPAASQTAAVKGGVTQQQVRQTTKSAPPPIREALQQKRERTRHERRDATRVVATLAVIAPRDRAIGQARYRYFLTLPGAAAGSAVKLSVEGDPCLRSEGRSDPVPTDRASGTTETRAYNSVCLAAWRDYVARLESVSLRGKADTMAFALPRGSGSMSDEDWTNFLRLPHVAAIRSKSGTRTVRLETVAFVDVDQDGDGIAAIRWGGLDCDDTDPDRWPGNSEVPDADGRDEDCDYRTIGVRDLDGDGFTDATIWNRRDDDGRPMRGDDCDDRNRGVNPGVPEIPGNGIDDNCDGDIDRHSSWRN